MKRRILSLGILIAVLLVFGNTAAFAMDGSSVYATGSMAESITIHDGEFSTTAYCFNSSLSAPDGGSEYVKAELNGVSNELIQALMRTLYAGYPINGMEYYELADSITQLSREDMLQRLTVSAEAASLLPDFQEGAVLDTKAAADEFVLAASQLGNEDVFGSKLYKAAYCMTMCETLDDATILYSQMHLAAEGFFLTEQDAFGATQNVIWALLEENGVPNNNRHSVSTSLEKRLYEYAKDGADLPGGSAQPELTANDAQFSLGADGIYVSTPVVIDGTGSFVLFDLPEGITVRGNTEDDHSVTGGTAFILESATRPETMTGRVNVESKTAIAVNGLRYYESIETGYRQNLIAFDTDTSKALGSFQYEFADEAVETPIVTPTPQQPVPPTGAVGETTEKPTVTPTPQQPVPPTGAVGETTEKPTVTPTPQQTVPPTGAVEGPSEGVQSNSGSSSSVSTDVVLLSHDILLEIPKTGDRITPVGFIALGAGLVLGMVWLAIRKIESAG